MNEIYKKAFNDELQKIAADDKPSRVVATAKRAAAGGATTAIAAAILKLITKKKFPVSVLSAGGLGALAGGIGGVTYPSGKPYKVTMKKVEEGKGRKSLFYPKSGRSYRLGIEKKNK